jgi:hypothetical protein
MSFVHRAIVLPGKDASGGAEYRDAFYYSFSYR